MTWETFIYFAIPAVISWAAGAYFAFKNKTTSAYLFTIAGILIFAAYIAGMWISLERPPLRTMGETRLWYSFFLPVAGLLTYMRWKFKWILSFSTVLALVFICVNIFKPEIHNKTLMPALQSPWFAPHVIIYMFSYAVLGAATIIGLYFLIRKQDKNFNVEVMNLIDNLVYVGTAFLSMGMLIGAVWAKDAWGHYWSWDPKETWAFITAAAYLIYIHVRLRESRPKKFTLWLIIFSFIFLMITWKGVAYLPSAQGSVHVYSE